MVLSQGIDQALQMKNLSQRAYGTVAFLEAVQEFLTGCVG